jgi:hypothetical protein
MNGLTSSVRNPRNCDARPSRAPLGKRGGRRPEHSPDHRRESGIVGRGEVACPELTLHRRHGGAVADPDDEQRRKLAVELAHQTRHLDGCPEEQVGVEHVKNLPRTGREWHGLTVHDKPTT